MINIRLAQPVKPAVVDVSVDDLSEPPDKQMGEPSATVGDRSCLDVCPVQNERRRELHHEKIV